ncbi:MAG: phosphatidate cytidylyltransferase [Kiritimatiellae bacterium]|nr:phosphatidate cytidylyltransferase [Kiritimatiellia bacterium]
MGSGNEDRKPPEVVAFPGSEGIDSDPHVSRGRIKGWRKRLVSGCIIGAVLVLATLFGPPWLLWLILVVASSVCQLEFYALMNHAGIPVFRVFGVVAGAGLVSVAFWLGDGGLPDIQSGPQWENLALLLTLMAVFLRQFPQKFNDKPLATIACSLLGVWYVPYLLKYFVPLLRILSDGGELVSCTGRQASLYLLVVVKFSDVGALVVGSMIGRHKVMPRISPGKTWEGLLGGVAVAMLASLVFVALGKWHIGKLALGAFQALALGLLLAVAGFWGDLFESLLKRAAGVKDSGTMLPGLGGLLDATDSLLFAVPVLYIFLRFVMRI